MPIALNALLGLMTLESLVIAPGLVRMRSEGLASLKYFHVAKLFLLPWTTRSTA